MWFKIGASSDADSNVDMLQEAPKLDGQGAPVVIDMSPAGGMGAPVAPVEGSPVSAIQAPTSLDTTPPMTFPPRPEISNPDVLNQQVAVKSGLADAAEKLGMERLPGGGFSSVGQPVPMESGPDIPKGRLTAVQKARLEALKAGVNGDGGGMTKDAMGADTVPSSPDQNSNPQAAFPNPTEVTVPSGDPAMNGDVETTGSSDRPLGEDVIVDPEQPGQSAEPGQQQVTEMPDVVVSSASDATLPAPDATVEVQGSQQTAGEVEANAQKDALDVSNDPSRNILAPHEVDRLREEGVIQGEGDDAIIGAPPLEAPPGPLPDDSGTTGESPQGEVSSADISGEGAVVSGSDLNVQPGEAVASGTMGGDAASDDVLETVSPTATADTEATAIPDLEEDSSVQVVEDVIRPLEDIMAIDLSSEIDRLSGLDAGKRKTEIKALVQKGIRAKLKKDGKEDLADAFDTMEELAEKIQAAQMVLEFMTGESQVVDEGEKQESI